MTACLKYGNGVGGGGGRWGWRIGRGRRRIVRMGDREKAWRSKRVNKSVTEWEGERETDRESERESERVRMRQCRNKLIIGERGRNHMLT